MALQWKHVTPDGPRPEGFALWLVPVTNSAARRTLLEVHYACEDEGGALMDEWGDDVGWEATDATHYAEIGSLPAC